MTEPQPTTSMLRADVPAGWSVTESWTLSSPDGQAGVVVAREPLPPVVRTEQYAQGLGDRLAADHPQYQQHVFTVLPLRSGPAYARLFSWAAPGGARVAQVQVYATTSGTGFTATATAPAASFEHVGEVLDGVLRSLRFGGGTTAQPAPAEPDPAVDPRPEQPHPLPPVTGSGSTSATVLVQLPRLPPEPRSP